MGETAGGGLLSHVPTIMLPEATRRELNHGEESTLVTGLRRLREEVFDTADYDTVVVFDSHWATTVEFVVASHACRAGLFTSDELPRGMSRIPYDFPGDPELAHALADRAEAHGTWITPIDDPCLPVSYATVNLWTYLGVPGKRWLSVSVCQTGDDEDHLRLGRALADAIASADRRVLLIASGALSHRFHSLRALRAHESAGAEHIFSQEAVTADAERIGWLESGDHAKVLATMADFRQFKPEAGFAHYLMLAGALGGQDCAAPARRCSEYENAIGTGQIHLWFDRPAGGWTGANR
ncbi:catechol 1,2-dioxygenase [Amycolatopsis sp. FU40]|uniref:DODA-type extradiol aromatic ring-opening family dioxygenase n=1 Tax=Amycolatopsis sp. FU40 TaxID=2914159 RepID=UPI001F402CD0|nr:catechol 1,2-dioxygenase [Amycolatopsis sp. FU40]UKD56917.1 catechol 1,2-dioxygenase [Amycolatopsis sp. FU40]